MSIHDPTYTLARLPGVAAARLGVSFFLNDRQVLPRQYEHNMGWTYVGDGFWGVDAGLRATRLLLETTS